MAKVKLVPEMVTELHGSLSKDSKYYFKTINGEIRMYEKSNRPPRPQTPQQKMQRVRFKEAQDAIKTLRQHAILQRWVNRLWQSHRKQYTTLQGWLMAEMMQQ